MYVCVFINTGMHVCVCVCVCLSIQVCMYVRVCVYQYMYVCVCVYQYRLQAQMGNKWAKIGLTLGRTGEAVRHRYCYLKGTKSKGNIST